MVIYCFCYRRITVQTEDLQYLKHLDSCPLSYLVANPTKVTDTHLRPVPVASGLSTHVSTKFFPLRIVLRQNIGITYSHFRKKVTKV